jgi:ferritin-like metal-binding protein YciE
MATPSDHLMDWLRDAHAAEQQAEAMLSGMSSRIEHYPALKARLEQHLKETQRQAELVRGCIERRGGSTSTIKDVGGKMLALGQAFSGAFFEDEVLKGVIASYAFEAMEVASYTILIDAATKVGDTITARVCEDILAEEKAMLAWLEQNIPSITQQYLSRDAGGATAKR